jgi:DNA-binding MarR family transcriptional regulator
VPQNTCCPGELLEEVRKFHALLQELTRNRPTRNLVPNPEALELTHSQFHTVLWLGLDGRLTMGELARRLGVTEKTVTGVVDRLEREGYVQRERDAADRRVVHVLLTVKGRETFEVMGVQIERKLTAFLGLLEPADRRDLFRILEKLNARLNPTAGSKDT